LVQRWWIYRYSPISSIGCDGSWSKLSTGMPPNRCATMTCALLLAASLFIDSQSHWRWCFFGSGNGGGSTSLITFV
jgi:hypothetical protein